MGALAGVFGVSRLALLEGSRRTSLAGLCRRLLCRLVGIGGGHDQCPALGRNHFLFSIRLCFGLLRLSHGYSGGSCRFAQDDSPWYLFDDPRIGRLGGGVFVVDEGVVGLYWAIHYPFQTSVGGLSSLVLLHILGVDDSIVLRKYYSDYVFISNVIM